MSNLTSPNTYGVTEWAMSNIGQRRRWHQVKSIVAISLVCFATAASADFMEVVVSVAAGNNQQVASDTASNILGDPRAFASTFAAIPGNTFGSAAGRAEAGSLGLLMQASADATEATFSNARALFRDSLLVSAPQLPLGTSVILTFDLMPPPAAAVGLCPACFIGFVTAEYNLIFGQAIRDRAVTWQQSVNGFGSYSGAFTSTLARVGDRINIEGILTGQLVVGRPNGAANFQIDLLNTVPFFADSQTVGVTLIAESGHDYRISAVPEIGSVWLLAWGIALLSAISRFWLRSS